MLTSALSRLPAPVRRTLGLGLAVFLAVALLDLIGVFEGVESLTVDMRYNARDRIAPLPVDTTIVTIDWDENAIQQLGHWPWNWDRHARLVDLLGLYEAHQAAIVDPIFSERMAATLSSGEAAALSENVGWCLAAGNLPALQQLLGLHDYAPELAAALAGYGRAMLAADVKLSERPGAEAGAAALLPDSFSVPFARRGAVLFAEEFKPPERNLMSALTGLGFNWILFDPDGIVRHLPAMAWHQGRVYPALAVAMAARRFGCSPDRIRYRPGEAIEFPGAHYADGRPVRIPIDRRGVMMINWAGDYWSDRMAHLPFLIVARAAAFHEAKRLAREQVLSLTPETDLGDLIQLAVAAAQQGLLDSRLVPEDEIPATAWNVADGLVAEHLLRHGATFADYLQLYLEGTDSDGIGRLRWDAVALNNRAAERLAAGETPAYDALLAELHLADTAFLRANYGQTLFFHGRGQLDEVRPLLFFAGEISDPQGGVLPWSPLDLRGKTVFVGLTATALNSLNPTPFSPRYQMLGMQPNAYNTIVTGAFLHEPPAMLVWLFVLGCTLLVTTLVLRLGTAGQTVFSLALAGALTAFAWYAFARWGWVLPVVMPLAAVALAHVTAVFYRYLEAQRERRKVRGLFSAMVSPEVLQLLEGNPERLALAGEKKDATMFSSDVSGFTTISEGVTAQELADILNIYLTPMSNIIMKYDGFVDKYEGDAIKASWGVPLPDPDHPWKGVVASLEQQEELKVIARMLLLKYGVRISARMGVNTGIIAAGNMGSDRKMQYTVMGEQVTLAEELEPVNKLYESWIAMGPETRRRSAEFVEARQLDTVRMGPARQAFDIFEPLGWKRDAYLAYWRERPVPPLFFELWRKMGPEKALAYGDYFREKPLPDGPMRDAMRRLFDDLSGPAVELIKITDIFQFHDFCQRMAELSRETERLRAGMEDSAEIAFLAAKRDAATEEWQKTIWEWRVHLRRFLATEERQPDAAARESLIKRVDALEKRTECYWKRAGFPSPSDRTGVSLAENLKTLLLDGDYMASRQEPAALRNRIVELERTIAVRIDVLLARLAEPDAARQFHEMMAEYCAVSEKHLVLRDRFDAARALYLGREWDRAEAGFRSCLELFPQDGPSLKYIERIARLRKNPPPADWDGVWEEE